MWHRSLWLHFTHWQSNEVYAFTRIKWWQHSEILTRYMWHAVEGRLRWTFHQCFHVFEDHEVLVRAFITLGSILKFQKRKQIFHHTETQISRQLCTAWKTINVTHDQTKFLGYLARITLQTGFGDRPSVRLYVLALTLHMNIFSSKRDVRFKPNFDLSIKVLRPCHWDRRSQWQWPWDRMFMKI